MGYIAKLYLVEKEARDQSPKLRQKLREQKAKPVLDEFRAWLDTKAASIPPTGAMGEAVHYTLKIWDDLIVYLKDGRIPIDNNMVENSIRPFVIGRKNWLFSGSPSGAHASAAIYSLIETLKANNIEPYWGLRYIFNHLPAAETSEDYEKLMPWNLDGDTIQAYK